LADNPPAPASRVAASTTTKGVFMPSGYTMPCRSASAAASPPGYLAHDSNPRLPAATGQSCH
jgi:hypothetical protein